jgi:hypothetical protein
MPTDSANTSTLRVRRWAWLCALALLLLLIFPLLGGGDLRLTAAQRRLHSHWQPQHRIIPLLQEAYALTGKEGKALTPGHLERLQRELQHYKGPHAEFFWLALSLVQARSGRLDAARQSLDRAKALDRSIVNMTIGPDWDPWRKGLGL